jgi:murein DD-endopeptidase MepM/ murein hydrolase activator NlpD
MRRSLLAFITFITFISFICFSFSMAIAAPAAVDAGLTVRVSPATSGGVLRPGGVVRVDLRSARPLAKVEATAFERPIAFVLAPDGRTATALVGLAVETTPGTYEISIQAETSAGEKLDATRELTVGKGLFPSHKLTVEPRFVQPPKDLLPRIEKERARLGELSHTVDRDRPWHAPFGPPLDTAVSEQFGVKRTFNGELASQHRGVDLRGAMGTPIAAPGAGLIVLADDLYYTGNTVVIDHGYGVLSLLAHMSKVLVHEGDLVERGTIVGEVGATGRVTGPHLHWTAWVGGVNVDPLSLIKAIDVSARAGRSSQTVGDHTRPPQE